ncbi:MAG TPA: TonB family protein [Pyrinomonadaceae bacterium]
MSRLKRIACVSIVFVVALALGLSDFSFASAQTTKRRARARRKVSRTVKRRAVVKTVAKPREVQGVVVDSSDSMPTSSPEPVAPTPTPIPRPRGPISGGVLNGKAISLPKPPYPPIAKAAKAGGTVVVQVQVDEAGNVTEARAVSGHPLLQSAAEAAARSAKFAPTQLSGQPVRVTGVITYNFVP